MGILKSIGDFLFGKDAKIFDEKGRVRHDLGEEKWKRWNDRFRSNPDYDWRDHTGQHLGSGPASRKSKKGATPTKPTSKH
ncbi:MAG: hypothetical protein NDI61_05535 [Bdellovibrionaceae bacterium]|nr:hypothetical protein [Pseudobdellovibrionaceae bacterium]